MKVRGLIIVVILVAFLLTILNLPLAITRPIRIGAREILAPYQSGITRMLRTTGDFFGVVKRWRQIDADRERFAGEIALLNNEIHRLEMSARENAELRTMLDYARTQRAPMVVAEVIAREDSGGWWRTVRLNKGGNRGVTAGLAVITVDGLVGVTTNVTPNTCDVLLISDPGCSISVRLVQAGTFGVLRGGGISLLGAPMLDILQPLGKMAVDFIDNTIEILPGDEAITSGLGGICPPELPVGVITRVYPDVSGLYQHCDVVPAADLMRLRRVFVILPPPPPPTSKPVSRKRGRT